ncbi:Trim71 [Symbiodinium pilosum]|uniref:Trim71 protein n=1 Tax=Symbiodinium pilosum TaxID=2952 RepID=A0A812QNG0_SYMPI|nr:Trim71 [Symbiodinium pilosum]
MDAGLGRACEVLSSAGPWSKQELCEVFLALGLAGAGALQRDLLCQMLSAFETEAGHVDCVKLCMSLAEAKGGTSTSNLECCSEWLTKDEAVELNLPGQADDPKDWMHAIFREISAGCSIPLVEERAMLLNQLNVVISCIFQGCDRHGWVDHSGSPLTPPMVNLYHTMDLLVRPATAARVCSFVELVAEAPQPCQWFVSHWWGEPVVDFAACLRQHQHDRNLPRSTAYWVCAYANNQWVVHEEIGADPATSSFQRAMRRAAGTVSILDSGAVCYTRVWCIYETYVSTLKQADGQEGLDGLSYFFDIYTNDPQMTEAVGIAEGFIAADGTGPKQARRKRHRESRFPFELIQRAFDIRVEHADASRESDRRMILNSIAQMDDLAAEPALEHEAYDVLNDILHGRFAAASFVKAASVGVDLMRHAEALSRSRLPQLALHFGGDCQKTLTDANVALLARSLPCESLQDLFLGCQGCRQLSDASAVALGAALGKLTRLRRLELRLSTGPTISDEGLVALAAGLHSGPSMLESLALDISGQKGITEDGCSSLARSLEHLPQLSKVHISLSAGSPGEPHVPDRIGCVHHPCGVAFDRTGRYFFIVDQSNHRVQVWDSSTQEVLGACGSKGLGPSHFDTPCGIVADRENKIVVSDLLNHRLQVLEFNPRTGDLQFLHSVGGEGTGPGQFSFPKGLGLTENGCLLVCDSANHRVQVLDMEDFHVVREFGSFGSGDGQFDSPLAATITCTGDILISDANNRIQVFDAKGSFLRSFGVRGRKDGFFHYPVGIAVNDENALFVCDQGNHRIQAGSHGSSGGSTPAFGFWSVL